MVRSGDVRDREESRVEEALSRNFETAALARDGDGMDGRRRVGWPTGASQSSQWDLGRLGGSEPKSGSPRQLPAGHAFESAMPLQKFKLQRAAAGLPGGAFLCGEMDLFTLLETPHGVGQRLVM